MKIAEIEDRVAFTDAQLARAAREKDALEAERRRAAAAARWDRVAAYGPSPAGLRAFLGALGGTFLLIGCWLTFASDARRLAAFRRRVAKPLRARWRAARRRAAAWAERAAARFVRKRPPPRHKRPVAFVEDSDGAASAAATPAASAAGSSPLSPGAPSPASSRATSPESAASPSDVTRAKALLGKLRAAARLRCVDGCELACAEIDFLLAEVAAKRVAARAGRRGWQHALLEDEARAVGAALPAWAAVEARVDAADDVESLEAAMAAAAAAGFSSKTTAMKRAKKRLKGLLDDLRGEVDAGGGSDDSDDDDERDAPPRVAPPRDAPAPRAPRAPEAPPAPTPKASSPKAPTPEAPTPKAPSPAASPPGSPASPPGLGGPAPPGLGPAHAPPGLGAAPPGLAPSAPARRPSAEARAGRAATELAEDLRRRAAGGDADAAFHLAIVYGRGLGVAQDQDESRRLLEQAAAAGHGDARSLLEIAAGGLEDDAEAAEAPEAPEEAPRPPSPAGLPESPPPPPRRAHVRRPSNHDIEVSMSLFASPFGWDQAGAGGTAKSAAERGSPWDGPELATPSALLARRERPDAGERARDAAVADFFGERSESGFASFLAELRAPAAPAAAAAPPPAPAAAPRVLGQVRWFAADRNYGFIVPHPAGADCFVHAGDLGAVFGPLKADDFVEFERAEYRGKPKATAVLRLSREEYVAKANAAASPSAGADELWAKARTTKLDDLPRLARVRWFEVAKKYGFLVPLEGGADHFLHLRDLEDAQAIRVGDVVTYRLAAFNGKTKACRVAKATPAAYAAATLAHEKRTVSLRDAAAEMAKLKDAPLPPKKEGDGGW